MSADSNDARTAPTHPFSALVKGGLVVGSLDIAYAIICNLLVHAFLIGVPEALFARKARIG